MELITTDGIQAVSSVFHQPRILTHDLVGRLAECNAAARAVRAMGYRVVEEDAAPNDGGKPVLLVDLNQQPVERLLNQCDASTRLAATGRITGLFQGVRIILGGTSC